MPATHNELKSRDMTNTHTHLVAQRKIIYSYLSEKNHRDLFSRGSYESDLTGGEEGRSIPGRTIIGNKRSKRFQKAY